MTEFLSDNVEKWQFVRRRKVENMIPWKRSLCIITPLWLGDVKLGVKVKFASSHFY